MRLIAIVGIIASLLNSTAMANPKCSAYNEAMANKLLGVDQSGTEHQTCRIGIIQDAKGNIDALNFRECPPAFRERAAKHIMSKAPFPAAPDPSCIDGEQTWSFGR